MRRKIGFRSLKMAEDRVEKLSRSVQERQDTILDNPPTFSLAFGTVSWAILGPSCAHKCRMLSCTVYVPDVIMYRFRAGCSLASFTSRMLACTVYGPHAILYCLWAGS